MAVGEESMYICSEIKGVAKRGMWEGSRGRERDERRARGEDV